MNSTIHAGCSCATDSNCYTLATFSNWSHAFSDVIPGAVIGCFTIDSLLRSTLQCYYSDSCLRLQYTFINASVRFLEASSLWFDAHRLVDDPGSSRSSVDTPLSTIVKEMMIEQWNYSFSFEQYYNVCAPVHCSYTFTGRTATAIGAIVTMISTIGGLATMLRLVTPTLVTVCTKLIRPRNRSRHSGTCWFESLHRTNLN